MPGDNVTRSLKKYFGDVEAFKTKFEAAAKSVFGSGWAWLCVDAQGDLVIMTTPNQDSPIATGARPILGLDVWEHAYYLQYENRRPDYIKAWWHIVDWEQVSDLLLQR